MGTQVLVTGGAGFIGSHLVDALVSEGHSVKVADNFSTGKREYLAANAGNIDIIEGDLADPDIAREACRDVEFVFHEAAIPSVPRSVEDPFATQRAGEIVTLRLLQACVQHKVHRMIFAASSSAYGDSPEMPRIESQYPAPMSPYAASKLACEGYLRAFTAQGLDTASLRYFNIFGPRQAPDSPYSAVIPIFLSKMRKGEAPIIYGDGTQTRDFTYVANVVQANLLAMKFPRNLNGAVFNVGCGSSISLNKLVEVLNTILNTSIIPKYGPARPGDVRDSFADIGRARDVLGYRPLVAFDEGIRLTEVSF